MDPAGDIARAMTLDIKNLIKNTKYENLLTLKNNSYLRIVKYLKHQTEMYLSTLFSHSTLVIKHIS